jgi:predicted esterase
VVPPAFAPSLAPLPNSGRSLCADPNSDRILGEAGRGSLGLRYNGRCTSLLRLRYFFARPCEMVNLRRAMDLLLSQPGVDAGRFALVGHDFGGMYGVLAGSLDRRPTQYVVMAATPRFPDWYLYSPKLEGGQREEFIRQFSPLDPITHIPHLSPAPVFFQFGTDDPHVPKNRAWEFYEAAKDPKEVRWYQSGHELNLDSTADRRKWLKEKLTLQK